jgi:hypothetical protein
MAANPQPFPILERGVERWHQAVELVDPPDSIRIGGTLIWASASWRIVKIAETMQPTEKKGIVVLLELKQQCA